MIRLTCTRIRIVDADDGSFAATIAQERAKIHRRRRLAERAGAWAREDPSSATRIKTVRRGKRTTTRGRGQYYQGSDSKRRQGDKA